MRIFRGRYDPAGARRIVTLDDRALELPALLAGEVRHSPTGFNWGYHGSGPAELARAMLVTACPGEPAARHPACYQEFKAEVLGRLQGEWEIEEPAVRTWFMLWRTTETGQMIMDELDAEAEIEIRKGG